QHEVARPVRVLRLARLEARLAEEGGLLIAEDGGQGDTLERALAFGDDTDRRDDLGQHVCGNPDLDGEVRIPCSGGKVHQQGSGGVGDVGHVTTGQVPSQPAVDGAE